MARMKLAVMFVVFATLVVPQKGDASDEKSMVKMLFDDVLTEKAGCLGMCILENVNKIVEDMQDPADQCMKKFDDFIKFANHSFSGLENVLENTATLGDTIGTLLCDLFKEAESLITCMTKIIKGHCGVMNVEWLMTFNERLKAFLKCGTDEKTMLHCLMEPDILINPIMLLIFTGKNDSCVAPLISPIIQTFINLDWEDEGEIIAVIMGLISDPKATLCHSMKPFAACMKDKMDKYKNNDGVCSGQGANFETELKQTMKFMGCYHDYYDGMTCGGKIVGSILKDTSNLGNTCVGDLASDDPDTVSISDIDIPACGIYSMMSCMNTTIANDCGEHWMYNKLNLIGGPIMAYFDYKASYRCSGETAPQLGPVIAGCKCAMDDYKLGKTGELAAVQCDVNKDPGTKFNDPDNVKDIPDNGTGSLQRHSLGPTILLLAFSLAKISS